MTAPGYRYRDGRLVATRGRARKTPAPGWWERAWYGWHRRNGAPPWLAAVRAGISQGHAQRLEAERRARERAA
jgi:hypothetical protein